MLNPKPFTIHSELCTQAARGQRCTLRLPGYCNHNPETVVACHLPGHNNGIGKKVNDIHIAFGCSSCHDIIDGRRRTMLSPAIILDACLRGLAETQHILFQLHILDVRDFSHEAIQ